jgi:ArsR family transcriptional regulator
MEKRNLIEMKILEEVAPTLRTLSHPLRLRILDVLKDGERSVTEIAVALNKTQPLTSHQLSIMRGRGVLTTRRMGPNVYYSVKNRAALGLLDCIRKAKTGR